VKGIDTNVLVRYLVQDDVKQARIATRFIEEECSADSPGYIGLVTLCELAWVLESNYQVGRVEIASILERLLCVEQFTVEQSSVVWRAVADARTSNADFPDHLVARIAEAAGCEATVTFDRKASNCHGFQLLK
jgi:predicted nucleic-acid-binding protein